MGSDPSAVVARSVPQDDPQLLFSGSQLLLKQDVVELVTINLLFLLFFGKPDQLSLLQVQAFFRIFNPALQAIPSGPLPSALVLHPTALLLPPSPPQ